MTTTVSDHSDPRSGPLLQTRRGEKQLPRWPMYALFVAFPIWWLLGVGDMVWPLMAIPMVLLLLRHGEIKAPKGFGLWLLFMVWMFFSLIEIDTGGRMIGFFYRALLYLAATVVFLYVYNSSTTTLPNKRIALLLTAYWVIVVAGGYLGVLFPSGSITTVMSHLMPGGLKNNELVSHMVTPRFTQGNPEGFYANKPRPSAPFAYTNGWGHNFAELAPFVLTALGYLKRGPLFWVIAAMVPISLVPAFLTVNRGMFLALGLGFGYAALRLALRGNARGLLALGLLILVGLGVNLAVGVQNRISERVSNSETNTTRLAVYQEAYERTLDSPIFGYGAPRPSVLGEGVPAIGTQGQFWNVLFSHGFVGAAAFLGWFVWLAWRTRRAPTMAALWMHLVVVMTTVMMFYYGLMDSGLIIAMIAGAVVLRDEAQQPPPVRRATPLLARSAG